MKYLILAVLVSAVASADPPKPNPSVDFYSDVDVEFHFTHEPTLFGEGAWLIDTDAGKSLEDYRFKVEGHILPFYSYNLQRFDLGQSFRIESFSFRECEERPVNGSIPQPWDWLSNATFQGYDEFRHVQLDFWGTSIGGVNFRIGVAAPDYDRPVLFEAFSHHGGTRIFFRRFDNNATLDSKYFDVPSECTSATVAAKAPQRPKIPATFTSEFELFAEKGGVREVGEGKWALDASLKAEASETRVRSEKGEGFIYELARFDVHKLYEITSENKTDCITKELKRNFTDPFAWVAKSEFKGTRTFRDHTTVDFWELSNSGLNLTIGVLQDKPDIPVFFGQTFSHGREEVVFSHFDPAKPDPEYFKVPTECQKN